MMPRVWENDKERRLGQPSGAHKVETGIFSVPQTHLICERDGWEAVVTWSYVRLLTKIEMRFANALAGSA
jgi:hypothetical protein